MKPRFNGAAMVKFLLRVILRPLFRVRVSGDPNLLKNERTLIVANHESFLDGALLGPSSRSMRFSWSMPRW